MKRGLSSLQDKVVLIVEKAGDTRTACARAHMHYGARIIIFNRNPGKIWERLDERKKGGIQADSCCGDITDEGFLESMAKEITAIHGRIDTALNNIAVTNRKPMLESITVQRRDVIDINLNDAYHFLREAGCVMCGQDHGKIIQIPSTGVCRFGANFSTYGVSKTGVSALVKCLAVEQVPHNIQVNGIAPTATEAGFTRGYCREYPEWMGVTIQNHPYKRLGQPEDYVGAAVYLASEAVDFVNGEVIIMDPGKMVKRGDVYWG